MESQSAMESIGQQIDLSIGRAQRQIDFLQTDPSKEAPVWTPEEDHLVREQQRGVMQQTQEEEILLRVLIGASEALEAAKAGSKISRMVIKPKQSIRLRRLASLRLLA